MEVKSGSPGAQAQWILGVGRLAWRHVLAALQHRLAIRVRRAVFSLLDCCPGKQVAPPRLAVLGACEELAVGIQATTAPLNAGAAAQLGIRDVALGTRPVSDTLLERRKRRFRVIPVNERLPMLIAKVHAARIIQPDFQVRSRLA